MEDKNHKDLHDQNQSADIDRLIHEPARLRVMAQLFVVQSADFTFIMNQTGLTQGNLSGHLLKLENAGYLNVKKGYIGKRPRTMIALTEKGREAFRAYISQMRQIFDELIE